MPKSLYGGANAPRVIFPRRHQWTGKMSRRKRNSSDSFIRMKCFPTFSASYLNAVRTSEFADSKEIHTNYFSSFARSELGERRILDRMTTQVNDSFERSWENSKEDGEDFSLKYLQTTQGLLKRGKCVFISKNFDIFLTFSQFFENDASTFENSRWNPLLNENFKL